MGSELFQAQYLQEPVPPGGGMIKWKWFRFYDEPPRYQPGDQLLISWDTASKVSELSDFSVATVWLARGRSYYLLDLVRARMEFPQLFKTAQDLCRKHPAATVVIEDAGSGTSLIQSLQSVHIWPIPVRPTGDKIVRAAGQTAKMEAGAVVLPRSAPWLDDLKIELLSFPGKRDDQVDSVTQALAWLEQHQLQHRTVVIGTYGSG